MQKLETSAKTDLGRQPVPAGHRGKVDRRTAKLRRDLAVSLFTMPAPAALRPRGTRTSVASPDDSAPWVIRVSHKFLDARLNAIDPRHLKMLLILEGVCRARSHGWIGNAQLAARYGCSYRHCQTILLQMERSGLIVRVLTTPGRKADRFGVILRDRADRTLPVATSDEDLAKALAGLGAAPVPTLFGTSPGADTSALRTLDGSCRRALDPAHPSGEGSLSEKDEPDKDGGPDPDQRSRQEKAETRPEPSPGPRPGPVAASPVTPREADPPPLRPEPPRDPDPPPPPRPVPPPRPTRPVPPEGPPGGSGLSPGQVDFLGRLTPEQRAVFDGWPEDRRAAKLAMFARGFDGCLFGEAVKSLTPDRGPRLPDPSTPTPDLIAYLSGHMGPSLASMTTRAIMLELDDRGGSKSFGMIENLCGRVVAGELEPDDLAEPLVRTLEAVRAGEPIGNPAAYWTRSVINRTRERPPN